MDTTPVNHHEDKDAAFERATEIEGIVVLSKGEYWSDSEGAMIRVWEELLYSYH